MIIKINNATITCENNIETIENLINEKLCRDKMVAIEFAFMQRCLTQTYKHIDNRNALC